MMSMQHFNLAPYLATSILGSRDHYFAPNLTNLLEHEICKSFASLYLKNNAQDFIDYSVSSNDPEHLFNTAIECYNRRLMSITEAEKEPEMDLESMASNNSSKSPPSFLSKTSPVKSKVGFFVSDILGEEEIEDVRCPHPLKAPSTLPAWIFCTRYSDRPSAGPRIKRKQARKERSNLLNKRPRTSFSQTQLSQLSKEFKMNKYLSESRRKTLSNQLCLKESQVKIWFQNKRAKVHNRQSLNGSIANETSEEDSDSKLNEQAPL